MFLRAGSGVKGGLRGLNFRVFAVGSFGGVGSEGLGTASP